ncbi:hypothetical protein RYX36_008523 [Vicia faba]
MAPNSVTIATDKANDFSLLQVHDLDSPIFQEKQKKSASTKQFTWVILLKLHKLVTCLTWLTNGLKSMFSLVKKRVSLSDIADENPKNTTRLYRFIKFFLALSILALVVEIIAHFNQWNLLVFQPWEVKSLLQWFYLGWLSFREDYVGPLVLLVSKFCILLFLIQSLDRLVLCVGCFWIKYKKLKPTFDDDVYDVEDPLSFPMVLVQIPMCNEREVTNLWFMLFFKQGCVHIGFDDYCNLVA